MEILEALPKISSNVNRFPLRHRIAVAGSLRRLTGWWCFTWVLLLLSMALPSRLLAIHAIIKDKDPIPRIHGPLTLGLSLKDFLKSVNGTEVKAVIGQFEDEARFQVERALFRDQVESVLSDFYTNTLFRIEINYKPLKNEDILLESLINQWSEKYGIPRTNFLPGVQLFFWDDGATRMILEVDESEGFKAYSVTFIDNDLFHKASRDRVQRETDGASSYGK